MREIKFRAWDNKSNMYVIAAHTMNIHTGQMSDLPERFIIEQFTGLHDKNGKEVYEGDIVREEQLSGVDIIAEVIYETPSFYFYNKQLDVESCAHAVNSKVIGNIHENPELLKG